MKFGVNFSVTFEAIAPGSYKNLGAGLNITYGIEETPYGKVLTALTDKGISDLLFITTSADEFISKLKKKWVKANFEMDNTITNKVINQIFYSKDNKPQINLYITGTYFQIKVWNALLNIPEGYTVSYRDVSEIISKPKAVRAVGGAIGKNPVHYLIPCHRVLRSNGEIGGYSGGIARKRAILENELRAPLKTHIQNRYKNK
jgi:AraC family transcriptional regulator of adaptative response/methylated-DNA-[protein]-cysteine methyltransferase